MKELKEFAQISTWQPVGHDERRLYDMAITGISRQEAKAAFETSESHFNVLYKKLKSEMARGVLDSELKGFSKIQRQQFDVRRQYETAMVMLQTGHKVAGIPLARATMKKAEKLTMYQVAMDLCRELLAHYSMVEADEKRKNQYFNKLWSYWREVQNELHAESIFFNFVFSLKKDLLTVGIEDQLEELGNTNSKSYRFHYMRLLAEAMLYQTSGRQDELINLCREAITFFNDFEEVPYVVKFSFVYRLIPVHLSRCNYSEAESVIEESLDGPAYGRHNWQVIMLFQSLLGFHTGNNDLALESYQKATRVPKKYRTTALVTQWELIRAYLELFDLETPGNWNLNKFKKVAEEISGTYSESFSCVLVELMHHLKNGKYDEFEEKIKGFKKLIENSSNDRNLNFCRILESVIKAKYNAVETKELANEFLLELSNRNRNVSATIEESEVVPFERLWYLLLNWLK